MAENKIMRWVFWALAALFYFYEYLLRVSPSVMVPELMSSFNISAASIGLLSAFYFIAYAPMQLPVGALMDRFGARRLLTFASFTCAVGSFIFAIALGFAFASFGRLLIGVGSSFAFVAMVYVCSHWFEKSKQALLVGLANSIGMLGAVFGGGPLSLLVHNVGWRKSMFILAISGLGLAAIILFLVRKNKAQVKNDEAQVNTHEPKKHSLLLGISIFFRCKQSWLNSFVTLLFYATTTGLGGLWGVPFIQETHNVSKEVASFAISMLFIGWLIGGPITGAIADRVGRKKSVILWSIFLTLASLLPVIYLPQIPISYVYVLVFLVGFFSSAELLNFTLATELNPPHIKGAAIACTNLLVALGSTIVLPVIGGLLDFFTTNIPTKDQLHCYGISDYQKALLVLPICLGIAFILALFLNNKTPRENDPDSLPNFE